MSAEPPPPAPSGLDRRDLLRLLGLIVALLAIVGLVVVASGGGGGSSEQSVGQARGILTQVTQTKLTLQRDDGSSESFTVRPEDGRTLDFFHLQQHASDALPSIVHYEQSGGEKYATRVDDAPY